VQCNLFVRPFHVISIDAALTLGTESNVLDRLAILSRFPPPFQISLVHPGVSLYVEYVEHNGTRHERRYGGIMGGAVNRASTRLRKSK
jgi:hypothetical protein